jgi:hypothetical protein
MVLVVGAAAAQGLEKHQQRRRENKIHFNVAPVFTKNGALRLIQ